MCLLNGCNFLANIPNIKITDCDNEYDVKHKMIFLFYWIPFYSYNLNIIRDFTKSTEDEKIKLYLKDLLHYR